MRRIAMVLALAAAAGGCQEGKLVTWRQQGKGAAAGAPEPSAAQEPAARQSSQPARGDASQGDPAAAYVNGSPIYRSQLYDLLVQSGGMRAVQHLIACRLVDQAAAEKNLTATDEEIQAEHEQTLAGMFPAIDEPRQRQAMLEQLFQRQRITPEQWRMTMRRNVLLGKLASERAEPGQDEILEAFNEKYGRKVIVRHVQLATLDEAQRMLELLRSGDDFQELAQKFSLSPSRRAGGLLPPIGESSKVVPKALHEVAWAMSRPGEISDIVQVGTTYHILYLDRIEEPKDVRFEDVREALEQEVRGAKRRAAGGELLRELIDKAEIRYVDPTLAAKAEQTEEQETQ